MSLLRRAAAACCLFVLLSLPAAAQEQRTFLDVSINTVSKGDTLVVLRGSDAFVSAAGVVDQGVQPKIAMVYAQLYLKVNEEALAFPFIEQLAATHADKTRDLVKEFLRVWTRNHDPNATRGRMTVKDFVGLMAWHDDNHLDQLKRALEGKA